MVGMTAEPIARDGRARRLKAATAAAHERLDKRIMAADPFRSLEGYGRFLLVQHAFHTDIDALFDDAALDALLPDLAGRRRLALIALDLTDLGFAAPAATPAPRFPRAAPASVADALGWLYVAEGSNLGAAFLLKEAEKLGLSDTFGARHLAGAPEGRGLHWRTYVAALDAVALSASEEQRAVSEAEAAFERVHALTEQLLPLRASEPV
jgi:heme oxygenase